MDQRRRPALVAGIRALAPDVVAFQEVVDVPDLLWTSRGPALWSRTPGTQGSL